MRPELPKLVSLSFIEKGGSIVVWEVRSIDLVPSKKNSLSGLSGESQSPSEELG